MNELKFDINERSRDLPGRRGQTAFEMVGAAETASCASAMLCLAADFVCAFLYHRSLSQRVFGCLYAPLMFVPVCARAQAKELRQADAISACHILTAKEAQKTHAIAPVRCWKSVKDNYLTRNAFALYVYPIVWMTSYALTAGVYLFRCVSPCSLPLCVVLPSYILDGRSPCVCLLLVCVCVCIYICVWVHVCVRVPSASCL